MVASTIRLLAPVTAAVRAASMSVPSPGAKSQPRVAGPTGVEPVLPAPVCLIEPAAHKSLKSAWKAVASADEETVMMLFSCRFQASSVQLVDPVQTAEVPLAWATALSRTMYLQCMSCPLGAVMARSCTSELPKWSATHCEVPGGAGSAAIRANVCTVGLLGLPAS